MNVLTSSPDISRVIGSNQINSKLQLQTNLCHWTNKIQSQVDIPDSLGI